MLKFEQLKHFLIHTTGHVVINKNGTKIMKNDNESDKFLFLNRCNQW